MTSIEASINERHLKDFNRLLQCAAKFGDELCISANKDIWEMAVTNSTKSAYCLFKLQPRFFSRYKLRGSPVFQRKGVKCQLIAKSMLAVLGKASATGSIQRLDLNIYDPQEELRSRRRKETSTADSSAEDSRTRAEMYEDERDEEGHTSGRQSKLIVRLICRHGITKKHSLYLSYTEFLRAEVDPNSTPSGFTIPARTLRDWLDHFSLSTGPAAAGTGGVKADNQLGWLFGKNEVRIKSWEGTSKGLCTELKLESGEFGVDVEGNERYVVDQDRVELTLPMKEFSAALQLADALTIDLSIAFSEPTQPLTMTYNASDEDDFDIFCAIATTTCDAFDGVDLVGPGGGGGGVQARSDRPPSSFNRFPAGIDGGVKRRTTSDLTDVDPQPVARDRNGSTSTSHINGKGNGNGNVSASGPGGSRHRSETPRRKTSRLDLTPARDVPMRSQSATRAQSSQTFSQRLNSNGSHANNGSNNNNSEHEKETESEPLFFPGGSQEDYSRSGPSQPAQPRLTQQEVLEMSGMGDLTEDDLGAMLDDAEEEDWAESQRELKGTGKGKGRSKRGGHRDGDGGMDVDMSMNDEEDEEALAAQIQAEEEEKEARKRRDGEVRRQFEADETIFGGAGTQGGASRRRPSHAANTVENDDHRGRGRELRDNVDETNTDNARRSSTSKNRSRSGSRSGSATGSRSRSKSRTRKPSRSGNTHASAPGSGPNPRRESTSRPPSSANNNNRNRRLSHSFSARVSYPSQEPDELGPDEEYDLPPTQRGESEGSGRSFQSFFKDD